MEAVLEELGVENVRYGDKEITASCPMHPVLLGRPDRHASWSINRFTGAHNCFSCGWKGGLATMYRDLTGVVPDDVDMEIRRTSVAAGIEKSVREIREPEPDWDFPEWLGPVPEELLAVRHVSVAAAAAYELRWDPKQRMWVLPIHDEWGQVVGAQYKQVGTVLTQPTGLAKAHHLFGLWAMRSHRQVALVESPLDAVRLYSIGVPAVASLGAWVSDEQCRLLSRYFSLVVMALDNDQTGQDAAQRTTDRLSRLGCPVFPFRYDGLPGKDPGDVEDDHLLLDAWTRTLSLR